MNKKTILLVEDDQDLLDITSKVLKEHFNVIPALNGAQAWDGLNKEKIDCIVSDLALPDIDGVDLLRKLRNANFDTPVIIVTGKSSLYYAEKCADLGVCGYINKPYDINYLIKRITAAINPEENNLSEPSKNNIHPKVNKCLKYINLHFAEPINKNSISEKLDISPDYLGKLFHKDIGVSFVSYLNRVRIEEAKKMLSSSSLCLAEIIDKVGFGTMQHFFKQFKRHTGTTPDEYRKRAVAEIS